MDRLVVNICYRDSETSRKPVTCICVRASTSIDLPILMIEERIRNDLTQTVWEG